MLIREGDAKMEIIKTWKWKLPQGPFAAPDNINPVLFRCPVHADDNQNLAPYVFNGETLYVCRTCGRVYQFDPSAERPGDVRKIWSSNQPFYEGYFTRHNQPQSKDVSLAFEFIHRMKHPFLETHSSEDPVDTAETLVRYFICLFSDRSGPLAASLFLGNNRYRVISEKDGYRISLDENPSKDFFCNIREGKDCISLESCEIVSENALGFTADVNLENWEDYRDYRFLKVEYLSDIPADAQIREDIPKHLNDARIENNGFSWVVKDPLGLDGYFSFHGKWDDDYLGTWADRG